MKGRPAKATISGSGMRGNWAKANAPPPMLTPQPTAHQPKYLGSRSSRTRSTALSAAPSPTPQIAPETTRNV